MVFLMASPGGAWRRLQALALTGMLTSLRRFHGTVKGSLYLGDQLGISMGIYSTKNGDFLGWNMLKPAKYGDFFPDLLQEFWQFRFDWDWLGIARQQSSLAMEKSSFSIIIVGVRGGFSLTLCDPQTVPTGILFNLTAIGILYKLQ